MALTGATQASLKNHAAASTLQAGWSVYFQWPPKRQFLMNQDLRVKGKKNFVILLSLQEEERAAEIRSFHSSG